MGIIYKITNLINNKSYIGQTTQDLNKRWLDHCSKGSCCKALSKAIHKYGKNSFRIEPIVSVLNNSDLNEIESYFIKYYNTFGTKGYYWFYEQDYTDQNLKKKINNECNKHKKPNSSSKYVGVSYIKSSKKWYACIQINRKTINLGSYNTELEARNAYIKKHQEVYHR